MRFRVFGCRKFGHLLSEREDRELTRSEEHFLDRHRVVCDGCRREEAAARRSLNMLRAAALDVSPGKGFDERLMRRIRVHRVRESIGYWSPALFGSAIACMSLLVMLHLLAAPPVGRSVGYPNGEARRTTLYPSLELSHVPRFDR